MADKKETDVKIDTAKDNKNSVESKINNNTKKNTKNNKKNNTKKNTNKTTTSGKTNKENSKKNTTGKTNSKAETNKDLKKTETKKTKNSNKKTDKEKYSKKEDIKKENNKNSKDKNDEVETIKEEKEEINKEVETTEKTKVIKIEAIKEALKQKKKLPKEESKKINKVLLKNFIIAGLILIYFIFLNLGFINIKSDVYVTDLKVFGMCILLFAVALIENAYKKENGETALYGVEMIVLAIVTIGLIYAKLMFSSQYAYIIVGASYIFLAYYLIKSMIIYIKRKKQYFINDMKEIIKEEE